MLHRHCLQGGKITFSEQTFAEVLKRENQIIDRVDTILEELRKMRAQLDPMIDAERFEIDYRQAVARNLDVLQLIGADVSLVNRRHRLSVAYITLSADGSRPLYPRQMPSLKRCQRRPNETSSRSIQR